VCFENGFLINNLLAESLPTAFGITFANVMDEDKRAMATKEVRIVVFMVIQ